MQALGEMAQPGLSMAQLIVPIVNEEVAQWKFDLAFASSCIRDCRLLCVEAFLSVLLAESIHRSWLGIAFLALQARKIEAESEPIPFFPDIFTAEQTKSIYIRLYKHPQLFSLAFSFSFSANLGLNSSTILFGSFQARAMYLHYDQPTSAACSPNDGAAFT